MPSKDNAAAMRAYREDLADGIPHDMTTTRLPFGPLEEVVRRRGVRLHDCWSGEHLARYRERGIPLVRADEWATRFGLHPVMIWGEAWWG